LVVDASFTIRLIVPSLQREAFRAQTEQWLAEGYELRAPTLWVYEMTSALCKSTFFGLLAEEEAVRAMAVMEELPVKLVPPDSAQSRRAFAWTCRLNRAAAYDSFYLALAASLGCELWTADRRLCNAVDLPWVRSMEERRAG
jgi:predicted nucleic acid-binding protein